MFICSTKAAVGFSFHWFLLVLESIYQESTMAEMKTEVNSRLLKKHEKTIFIYVKSFTWCKASCHHYNLGQ